MKRPLRKLTQRDRTHTLTSCKQVSHLTHDERRSHAVCVRLMSASYVFACGVYKFRWKNSGLRIPQSARATRSSRELLCCGGWHLSIDEKRQVLVPPNTRSCFESCNLPNPYGIVPVPLKVNIVSFQTLCAIHAFGELILWRCIRCECFVRNSIALKSFHSSFVDSVQLSVRRIRFPNWFSTNFL